MSSEKRRFEPRVAMIYLFYSSWGATILPPCNHADHFEIAVASLFQIYGSRNTQHQRGTDQAQIPNEDEPTTICLCAHTAVDCVARCIRSLATVQIGRSRSSPRRSKGHFDLTFCLAPEWGCRQVVGDPDFKRVRSFHLDQIHRKSIKRSAGILPL